MKRYIPILVGLATAVSLTGCSQTGPALLDAQSTASNQPANEENNGDHSFTGKVTGIDEVQIVSKVSGRVEKVLKDVGDSVNPGDELVSLEKTDLDAQLASAKSDLALSQAKYNDLMNGSRAEDKRAAEATYEAALAKYQDAKNGARAEQITTLKESQVAAKTAFETASSNLDRVKSLYDQGAATKQAYEDAVNALNQAEARYTSAQGELKMAVDGPTEETLKAYQASVEQAKAMLDKANNGATAEEKDEAKAAVDKAQAMVSLNQYSLDNGTLKSPIKGFIAAKNISAGELAAPGSAVMTVVNIDQIYVSIEVPESNLKELKMDQDVEAEITSLAKSFKGKITNISPKALPGTNKFLVKILIDNPDHVIRSGMTGLVKL
ncbi:MAG TPA: efflux RND transporter periplasmic adaptor subunit [Bacillota bacterium]|nr:efflux RND transporter periplasmic adaptor subunit [Bacillota bacterium]